MKESFPRLNGCDDPRLCGRQPRSKKEEEKNQAKPASVLLGGLAPQEGGQERALRLGRGVAAHTMTHLKAKACNQEMTIHLTLKR
jgi:hypothetical protein